MASRFDDELWELVTAPGPPPAHIAAFVRSLAPAQMALDVGCGDGRVTGLVRAERLTGADVSAVALARAAERVARATLVELEPDHPLPLADSGYDLVLCTETIEHVRDTQLLFSELRRVLRPGGVLALTTPAHGRGSVLELLVRGFEAAFDPRSPHLRFYTRSSLGKLLDDMGFGVRSIEVRAGTLMALASR